MDLSLSELININEFFGTKAIVDLGTQEQKAGGLFVSNLITWIPVMIERV
jgi:hypothetical protein